MRQKVKVIEHGPHWTVIDLELGHRICNNYQDSKNMDAPSHIHDRFDNVTAPCSAETPAHAFRAMVEYRKAHTGLDSKALQREVKKWK